MAAVNWILASESFSAGERRCAGLLRSACGQHAAHAATLRWTKIEVARKSEPREA